MIVQTIKRIINVIPQRRLLTENSCPSLQKVTIHL